jgi:release factor glutamine methyltransferase
MQRFTAYIESKLHPIYPAREIKAFSRVLLRDLAGWNSVQIHIGKDTKIPEETFQHLVEAVNRLALQEPIQYITGKTEFYDLTFQVRPGVLIPRPETEELVELILKDHCLSESKSSLRLLDIGTGSGCIAVSLAKKLPEATVSAWDISAEALEIALENARLNGTTVFFEQVDILAFEPSTKDENTWDVMVSNPPYVRQCEKTEMEQHVLKHEPHLALFVEDEDPLLFYRVIAGLALRMLKKGGLLYFEINSHLGRETLDLIREIGFEDATLIQDLSGRDRIIRTKR